MKILDRVYAEIIYRLLNIFKTDEGDFSHFKHFEFWQDRGIHITPNHFYQPIPDTSKIPRSAFSKKYNLSAIKMNKKYQVGLLDKFTKYKSEMDAFKILSNIVDDQIDPNFYFKNFAFDNVDALLYYCMIRYFKPRNIIEVGSGWSTKIAAKAALKNSNTNLVCIEPYPQSILTKGFRGLTKVIEKPVQDINISHFEKLKENDILFIDSSHTIKISGDVNYLFFDVLPKLSKGVIVHFHDIFIPRDYPKSWVINEKRFWSEQYVLHAFLMYNNAYEILFSVNHMTSEHKKKMKSVFTNSPKISGGSFWIRKIV